MFSNIFTKAKGLFGSQEPESTEDEATSSENRDQQQQQKKNMAVATRRSRRLAGEPSPEVSDIDMLTPRRRTRSAATNGEGQAKKRRKTDKTDDSNEESSTTAVVEVPETQNVHGQNSLEVIDESPAETQEIVEDTPAPAEVPETQFDAQTETPTQTQAQTQDAEESESAKETRQEPVSTGNHIRFDSEEPVPVPVVEQTPETQVKEDSESESDDDDEAPEAIDNSAQLLALKAEAQRQEEARRKEEQAKKEKRRQLDELRKQQARAAGKSKSQKSTTSPSLENGTLQDDEVSESTATLQGSVAKETGRRALPALLPDEILNAVPADRLPTPPPDIQRKYSKRHRFFDEEEKPPKDIRRGDVTIRVLDDKAAKSTLAPKSSKQGQKVREAWIAGKRNPKPLPGLKRVPGGKKGFVRR